MQKPGGGEAGPFPKCHEHFGEHLVRNGGADQWAKQLRRNTCAYIALRRSFLKDEGTLMFRAVVHIHPAIPKIQQLRRKRIAIT